MVPRIDQVIRDWRSNYDSKDDPEGHFDLLVSALEDYRKELSNDPTLIKNIDSALDNIKQAVEELCSEHTHEPDSDDFRGDGSSAIATDDSRSIFDDVDQG